MLVINKGLNEVHTSLICSLPEFWPFVTEPYMCVLPSHESYFQANCSVSSPVKAVSHLAYESVFIPCLSLLLSLEVWTMDDDCVYYMQDECSQGDLVLMWLNNTGDTQCFSPLWFHTGLTPASWSPLAFALLIGEWLCTRLCRSAWFSNDKRKILWEGLSFRQQWQWQSQNN